MQNFSKNIKPYCGRSSSKFSIFRQNTWFLENNRALSKVMYGSLYYSVSNIKHQKNRSKKLNFILTSRPTLSSYSGKHRLINTSLLSYYRLTITWLSAHPQTLLIIFEFFLFSSVLISPFITLWIISFKE